MRTKIHAIHDLGQSIWCDNLSRAMIRSGELSRLIDLGIVGITSNPTIFMKAITGGADYDEQFEDLLTAGEEDLVAIYEKLVVPDIADAADILRPVYEKTRGLDGFVSLEVNPKLAHDTKATVAEARRLFAELSRPNVFIKVPATNEGIPAIETLIGDGVNVNVTLIFAVEMYERVCEAYIGGLKRLQGAGGDLSQVSSVASFFVSRVDTLVDKLLSHEGTKARSHEGMSSSHEATKPRSHEGTDTRGELRTSVRADVRSGGDTAVSKFRKNMTGEVGDLFGKAAVANAKIAYARFQELFSAAGEFEPLAKAGARAQRPLWASTSTKNPNYSDTMYLDPLIGPHTVNTLPPQTIGAVLDHAVPAVTVDTGLDEAQRLLDRLEQVGISMKIVTDQLTREGVAAFTQSFEELLANLAQKQERLRART